MYYNPYIPQDFQSPQKITRVNGENGARAYQLPPNSEILLLDESAPLVWLAVTDGAGYKTVTPYTIEPFAPKSLSIEDLDNRLQRLEMMFNEQSYPTEPKSEATASATATETAVSTVRKGKSRSNSGADTA